MYYSKKCSIFYIALLIFSLLLIIVTVIEGVQITKTIFFIICEFIINFLITMDFIFRLKLSGVKKFFLTNVGKPKWWSWFDTLIVVTCNLVFIIVVIIRNQLVENIVDGLEGSFFIVLAFW